MTTITAATAADIEPIVDAWLLLARDQQRYGSTLKIEENRTAIRKEVTHLIVADNLFVARREGELCGFVMFHTQDGVYSESVSRGTVTNIFVLPAYRGEGIGSALLSKAENALYEDGVDLVTLEVLAENVDARRFYDREGYSPHRIEVAKEFERDNNSREHR